MKRVVLLLSVLVAVVSARTVMSWVPYNHVAACKAVVEENFGAYSVKDGLSHLGLQFWTFDNSGNVSFFQHDPMATGDDVKYFRNWGTTNSVEILLAITNLNSGWNWNMATAVLGDKTKRTNLINNLITEMNAYNLDGIEVDIEGSWGSGSMPGRADFALFIKEISAILKPAGKHLSVSTFHSPCINAPNMSWWGDWAGYVDNIQTMGYNDAFPGGSAIFSNCTDDISQNNVAYNNYRYQQEYSTQDQGLSPAVLAIGMPGTLDAWGWSLPSLLPVRNCLDSVLALPEPSGVSIWDLRLSAGGMWRESATWEKLKEIKEYGEFTRYKVTAVAHDGGTISPFGVVKVDSAASKEFIITPKQWFVVDYVVVDGENKGAITTHTFNKVTQEHTIEAFFKEDPQAPELFTISTTSQPNGAIDPAGNSKVEKEGNFNFTVNPAGGFVVERVMINGVNRGPIISGSITNVLKSHSIESFYKKSESLGNYPKYNPAKDYGGKGDTVTYDDNIFYSWYWPPLRDYPDVSNTTQTQSSAWVFIGADVVDTLITATLDYRSAIDGSDTLIIKTDTVVAGGATRSGTQTITLLATSIERRGAISYQESGLSISTSGKTFSAPVKGNYSIKIFDIRGRVLLTNSVAVASAGTVSTGVKHASLSKGVYLLQVVGHKSTKTQRIKISR